MSPLPFTEGKANAWIYILMTKRFYGGLISMAEEITRKYKEREPKW